MKHAIGVGAAFVFLAVSFGACSSSTAPTIKASDYDQTCAQSTDCAVIDEGSSCCGGCGNAAINKKDLSRYQSDATKRRSACTGVACPAYDCAYATAVCTAGKCAVCRSASCEPDSGAPDSGVPDSGADSGASDAKAD